MWLPCLALFLTTGAFAQNASFSPRLPVEETFVGARAVELADIDGDGDLDVVAAALSDRHVAWWENTDGKGRWAYHEVVNDEMTLAEPADIAVADVDGDGDADIVVSFVATSQVVWFDNMSSDGSLWAPRSITEGAALFLDGPVAVEAADMDGDGDIDIVTSAILATGDGPDVVVWRNDPPGPGLDADGSVWTPIPVSTAFDGARVLKIADVDGDSFPDIVGASEESGLMWWRNDDGDATVWSPQPISDALAAFDIDVGDLDDDGDLDILSADSVAGVVTWWENTQGDGSQWTGHDIDDDFPSASAVHLSDLDGNGTLDVIAGRAVRVGAQVMGTVVWWENDLDSVPGTVVLTPYTLDAEAGGVAHIASGDVDDDLDLDIVSASDDGFAAPASDLAWYINRTAASAPRILTAEAVDPTHVRLRFTEAMTDNAALTAVGSYSFSDGLQIQEVTLPVVGDTSLIEIRTDEMLQGHVYTATVATSGGPTSSAGIPFTAGENTAVFDGLGEAPEITVLGSNPFTIRRGVAYNDPGATAVDNVDGDLTAEIEVTNDVDTSRIGVYTVTYTVSDAAGNTAVATRTVRVGGGDVNGDDLVNAVDIQLIINGVLGIDIEPYTEAADLNGDGLLNAVDVQLIINAVLGL